MSDKETNTDEKQDETQNEKQNKSLYMKHKNILNSTNLQIETKSSTNLANLDKFLENEKNNNANEPWSKLDKTAKIKKLTLYAENYKTKNNLNSEDYSKLISFFRDCLERKKLQRVKDVVYDKTTGEIKDVPALYFNKNNNNFTLKNIDKRVSTIRSLAPKKINGTIKNTIKDKDSESEDEN
jgi:hypothetical protein